MPLQNFFSMNTQIYEQICQLKRQILPNEKVILFGSQARGDEHEESDWDLLILLNKQKSEKDDFYNYGYPFTKMGWTNGTCIVPLIYTVTEWEIRRYSPFYEDVEQDGIEIL